jgi:hypothetical protein
LLAADAVAIWIGSADPNVTEALGTFLGGLRSAAAGPIVVQVLVQPSTDGPTFDEFVVGLRSLAPALASLAKPFDAIEVDWFEALVRDLHEHRAPALRSASGLRLLAELADQANSPADRSHILQAVDLVRAELSELDELEVLRGLSGGRVGLLPVLRDDIVPLLAFSDPGRRLRQEPATDRVALLRVVEDLGTRWRVMENTGRIPFSARAAVLTAQQSLDRLHVDLSRTAS